MQKGNQKIAPEQILDVAGVIIVTLDKDGNVTTINKYGCKLLEYSEKEIVGKNWFNNFIPKSSSKDVKQVFNKIISGKLKPTEYFDNPILTKNGEERIISWHNAILKNSKGKIIGTISSGIDATKEKNIEHEKEKVANMLSIIRNVNQLILREKNREKFLKSVVKTLGSAKDYNCVFLAVFNESGKFDKIYYEGTEKLNKRQLQKIHNSKYLNKFKRKEIFVVENDEKQHFNNVPKYKAMAALLRHGNSNYGVLTIHLSAGVFPSNEMMDLFKELSNDIAYALYAIEKNQEKVKAEEELLKSQEIFHQTLDNMLEGCQIIGFEWRYLYVNDAAIKHGRKTKKELLGHTMMEVYPDIQNTAMFEALNYCMKKRKQKTLVNEFFYPNGDTAWFELSIQPVPEGIFILSIDITERKKAEDLLKESENRFRQITESTEEFIWEVDTKGLYTYASPVIEKILGYNPKEIIGKKHFYDLFTPDVRGALKKAVFKNFSAKKSFKGLVNPNLHKDGRIVIFETSALPILDSKGNLLGYRGADIDITERRKTEEKYKNLINTLKDIVYVADQNGIMTFVTPNVEDYGYKVEEIIGKSLPYFIHPEDLKKVVKDFEETLISGREFPTQFRLKKKNGDYVFVEDFGVRVVDENGEANVHGVLRDLTDIKRAELKYKSVIENATEIILIVQDGKIAMTNPRTMNISGFSEKELTSKPFTEFIYPDDREMVVANHVRRLKGETLPSYDFRILKKKGGYFWVQITAVALKWDGKLAVLIFLNDITERKQVEEIFRQSQAEYNQLIEASLDGYVTTTVDGKFLDCNSAYEKMLGYTISELRKLNYSQITPKKWHKWESHLVKNKIIKEGKSGLYQKEYIRKNGEVFPVELSTYLIKDEKENPKKMLAFARDITERTESENAIKEAESKYRDIVENSPEMIHSIDEKGYVVFANSKEYELLGYKPGELVGLHMSKLYSPDLMNEVKRGFEKLKKEGSLYIPSSQMMKKNGKPIDVEIHSIAIYDKSGKYNGKFVRTRSIARDITDEKKAELELAKMQLGFERSDQIMFMTNADGKINYVNPAFERQYGYKFDEVEGKNPRIFKSDKQSPEFYKKFWSNLLNKKSVNVELINKTKKGELINIKTSVNPIIENDKIIGFLAIQTNITEQKKAGQELNEKLEQMEFVGRVNLKRHKKMLMMEKEIGKLKAEIDQLKTK